MFADHHKLHLSPVPQSADDDLEVFIENNGPRKLIPGRYIDVLGAEICQSAEFRNLCIYTLPLKLIEEIQHQQPQLFSAKQLDKELKFSRNYSQAVVFDRGQAKLSAHLQDFLPFFDEATYVAMGGKAYQRICGVVDTDLRKINQIVKAYCGWLVQQKEYQVDLAGLREAILRHQKETSASSPVSGQMDADKLDTKSDCVQITELKQHFCKKWRLQSLITSELPDPLPLHLSEINFYAKDAPEGAVVPFIPDFFPIHGSGFVVESLNASRQDPEASHLCDWWKRTSRSTGNSRPFETLSRQYRLQHYWRVLKTRFPNEVHRKQKVFSGIFADFLQTSDDTIRRDFQQLKRTSELLEIPIEVRF